MKADQRDRITRLHLLNTLFPLLTGQDLYLARHIEQTINFAATGDIEDPGQPEAFNQALVQLLEKYLTRDQNFGFYHWEAFLNDRPFDPLWAREEIISGLKQIAGFPKAMFIGTGLRSAIQGQHNNWPSKLDHEYEEAVGYLRELAAYWTTKNTELTLILL
ncbi:MAG: hypothetical protein O3C43_21620 [Verrucomicrobia bacterium]|nr:hypothetical protein [Verrucomicrobiota bacterium]MDA1069093.1 hypothetical protein [Verrucomicrobiota bacterium]